MYRRDDETLTGSIGHIIAITDNDEADALIDGRLLLVRSARGAPLCIGDRVTIIEVGDRLLADPASRLLGIFPSYRALVRGDYDEDSG